MRFLPDQTHFSRRLQLDLFRQSSWSTLQILKTSFIYYFKLLKGLIVVYQFFLLPKITKKNIILLVNHREGIQSLQLQSLFSHSTYSPVQEFKITSDFPPISNIIVFFTHNERVEQLFRVLHDLLVLSCRFINQLPVQACL